MIKVNNHEYLVNVLVVVATLMGLIYLVVTMASWLVGGVPLFQVLREQWEWMGSVRIR